MAPTLTAAVQQQTRVLLNLTWPGIQRALVQRLDPDGVWRNVRSTSADDLQVCLGSCALFDHEAPLDVPVTYRAVVPTGGVIATDPFNRSVASGWGTTETGLVWSLGAGTASDFSVDTVRGIQAHNAVNATHNAQFATTVLAVPDMSARIDYSNNTSLPSGADFNSFYDFRFIDANNHFRLNVRIKTDNTVTAELQRILGGSPATMQGPVTVAGVTAGNFLSIRVQCVGTQVSAKVWVTGNSEPTTWLLDAPNTEITGSGGFRVSSVLFPGNTNTLPVQFRSDNLIITTTSDLIGVTSSPVTVPSGGQAWLTHPGHPSFAGMATVTRDGLTEGRPARRGVFSPIGTSLPVVVNDVRGGSIGTVVIQTSSTADIARLRNMLADGAPLLLRQPALWGGDSWWVSFGDVDIDRFTRIATDNWRHWTLPYLRVDRPLGASDGPVGLTYNDLKAAGYANYNALAATGKTYTQLTQALT